jgi:hypothetical protein
VRSPARSRPRRGHEGDWIVGHPHGSGLYAANAARSRYGVQALAILGSPKERSPPRTICAAVPPVGSAYDILTVSAGSPEKKAIEWFVHSLAQASMRFASLGPCSTRPLGRSDVRLSPAVRETYVSPAP